MLWFVGRAIQAAAVVDDDVKKEFENLPDGFTFSLGVMPNGPTMIVGKNRRGKVKIPGVEPERQADRSEDEDQKTSKRPF